MLLTCCSQIEANLSRRDSLDKFDSAIQLYKVWARVLCLSLTCIVPVMTPHIAAATHGGAACIREWQHDS